MNRWLTKTERAAVLEVLDERLAGSVEDLADALGCSEERAELVWEALVSAQEKLA